MFLGEVPIPEKKESNAARFAEKELEAGRTGDVYDTVASMDELLRSAGFIMSLLEKNKHPDVQYVSFVFGCCSRARCIRTHWHLAANTSPLTSFILEG